METNKEARIKLLEQALEFYSGACNVSGGLKTIERLRNEGAAPGFVNEDPAIKLFIAQMAFLIRTDGHGSFRDKNGDYLDVEAQCREELEALKSGI